MAKGLCMTHYAAERLTRAAAADQTCTADDCDSPRLAKGLCSHHYNRARARRLPTDESEACAVEGCRRATHAQGLCRLHYSRQQRTGTTEDLRAYRRGQAT